METLSAHDRREERLGEVLRWAKEIPAPLEELHRRRGPDVHLRPAKSGLTLVGLTPERPQRGKGGIHDVSHLLANFEQLFEEHCLPDGHGRETSEKGVQSALIRDAYANERRMAILGRATITTEDPVIPIFVADELSLPDDDDGEICCDLLAVREITPERFRPIAIELKWQRQMKRLIEQVTGFADLVEEHRSSFEALVQGILDRHIRLEPRCERWVVWPTLDPHAPEPRAESFAAHRIRVLGYWWDGAVLKVAS